MGGFVCKKENRKGLFGKKGYKGGGSLVNRGKAGVFGQKALLLPLPTQNRGEGGALGAGVDPGALGDGGGRGRGQKREETEGVRLPSYLGWGGVWRAGHEDRRRRC